MTTVLERTSTLTEKGQTTVPKAVRETLGLRTGDQIAFQIDDRGAVSLSRIGEDESAIDAFLAFISNDIKARPANVRLMDAEREARIEELVAHVAVDLDEDLSGAASL